MTLLITSSPPQSTGLSNQMSNIASPPSLEDHNPGTACARPNLSKPTLRETPLSDHNPTASSLSRPIPLNQPISSLSISTTLCPPPYPGSGTLCDPYIVDFLPSSPLNPYNWSKRYRWAITALIGVTALCPPFASVSYSSTVGEVVKAYGISRELAIAGISLFILGEPSSPSFLPTTRRSSPIIQARLYSSPQLLNLYQASVSDPSFGPLSPNYMAANLPLPLPTLSSQFSTSVPLFPITQ